MKNSTYKGSYGGKAMLKEAVMAAAVLFFLATGFVFPTKTGAEEAQKAGKERAQQSQPTGESREELKKPGAEEGEKSVAARVNGVDITAQSVLAMMNRLVSKRGHGDASPEGIEEIRKAALNRLILQELALQKAKAGGLKVEQEKIDSAMAGIKTSLGGEEGYRKYLEREGMTGEEMKGQVERSLTLELTFLKEVSEKTSVSEDELKREYEKEKIKHFTPEKVSVIDVVLFLSPEDKASEEKAEKVLREIKDDRDANPRNLVPDGTFIVRETDIKKDKDKELYEAALKLKEGELSGIIKTSDSLHIIKMKKYTPEKQLTFEEARGFIEGKVRARARQKRLLEWETELRQGAKIEIMEIRSEK